MLAVHRHGINANVTNTVSGATSAKWLTRCESPQLPGNCSAWHEGAAAAINVLLGSTCRQLVRSVHRFLDTVAIDMYLAGKRRSTTRIKNTDVKKQAHSCAILG